MTHAACDIELSLGNIAAGANLMSSQAFEQFNEIMADPSGVLDQMVSVNQPETEFLEFKGGRIAANLPQARAYFSEILSAFANTSGGVLVFGIDARPNQTTNIDGATEKALVPNVTTFRNALWARRLQATTDAIVGLRIEAVPEQEDQGFVICYVPEGTVKPHRAEFADGKYFMRNGDSNTVIPHAVLRAMFYPRSQPNLRFQWWHRRSIQDTYEFGITLANIGTATAEDLYVKWFMHTKRQLHLDADDPLLFDGDSITAMRGLHPGEQFGLFGSADKEDLRQCEVDVTIYCRNSSPSRQRLVLSSRPRLLMHNAQLDFEEVGGDDD